MCDGCLNLDFRYNKEEVERSVYKMNRCIMNDIKVKWMTKGIRVAMRWVILLFSIMVLISAVTSCSNTVSTGINGIKLEKSLIKDERKSSGWKAFEDGDTGLYGFKDQNGEVVIEPTYDEAWDFYGGRAIVKVERDESERVFGALSDGVYGLITPKGDYEVDPEGLILRIDTWHYLVTDQTTFFDGYGIGGNSVVKYHMIDGSGVKHGDQSYYYVIPVDDHIFVANDGYKSVFIDDDGKVLVQYPEFYFPIKATLAFETVIISPMDDTQNRMKWEMNLDGTGLQTLHAVEKVKEGLSYQTQTLSNYLGLSVFFPEFKSDDTELQENLNRGILSLAKSYMTYQTDQIPLDYEQLDRLRYTAKTDYKIEIIGNVLIYQVEGYWMGLGASHSNPHKQTFYFDMNTGEQYVVDQLFDPSKSWKKVLLEKVDEKFMEDDSLFLYYDESTPIENRLQAYEKARLGFDFSFSAVKIYFPVYELGPYAALFPTCEIALSEIEGYFDTNGDFYKSLFGF